MQRLCLANMGSIDTAGQSPKPIFSRPGGRVCNNHRRDDALEPAALGDPAECGAWYGTPGVATSRRLSKGDKTLEHVRLLCQLAYTEVAAPGVPSSMSHLEQGPLAWQASMLSFGVGGDTPHQGRTSSVFGLRE